MSDEKIAHLGFIQGVISRMGSNSFLLKGWAVTLVAAIFALSSKDSNANFIFIALFPVIVFWILDAYYLHQEKLYRKLYEEIVEGSGSHPVFMMQTDTVKRKVPSTVRLAFTFSIFPLYSLIIFLLLALACQTGMQIT